MSVCPSLLLCCRGMLLPRAVLSLLTILCLQSTFLLSSADAQLTTKNLIGDAVSLSNQSYPDIENAIQRFGNGDIEGAKLFLDKAKAKHPQLPPPEITMAKMQMAARNSAAVRFLLESAAVKYPNDPEAYLILADRAFAEGRTTEASALFEKADVLVQRFNENAKRKRSFVGRVLAGRSAIVERRQQWEDALTLLRRWIEIDPDNALARQRLGVVLFRLKKPSEAIEQLSKAREISSASPHPYVLVGKLFVQEGNDEEARLAFEKAYAEEKTNVETARAYADWLIQDDRLDKAQEVATALLKQNPDSINALFLDGVIAEMRGESARAEKAMMKVLSLDPSNAVATNLLAQLLIERDDDSAKDRALSYAQLNAERFPNSGQANITLAWVLYRLGRMREADAALKKGVQAANSSLDSAYFVAKILADQNRKRPAKQALQQAVGKTGLFIYRKQAEKLLAKLQAESE